MPHSTRCQDSHTTRQRRIEINRLPSASGDLAPSLFIFLIRFPASKHRETRAAPRWCASLDPGTTAFLFVATMSVASTIPHSLAAPSVGALRARRVGAARGRCHTQRLASTRVAAAAPNKSIEECKVLLERDGWKMLDIRAWKAYDREHLTKPPQCTANIPLGEDEDPAGGRFVGAVEEAGFRKGAKLLVADADGTRAQAAADALASAGFTSVVAVDGGYDGWRVVFTTCGRRRPPQGKWVSTGREALKSGLDLDPNVAAAYEENWGKAPPKHGETGGSLRDASSEGTSQAAVSDAEPASRPYNQGGSYW